MQKTRCFLKNNTFLLKILFISGCLGAIGTSLYCLFHKYIQYKFETNEDIYYAYQHIDIANWNLGAGLLVWGLGLILFYFYVKLIIKNETTKKLEIKQKSRALTVYLVYNFYSYYNFNWLTDFINSEYLWLRNYNISFISIMVGLVHNFINVLFCIKLA
ncbi:hypothetical protein EFS28_03475 [Lactobacillus acidophilus]|uniref:hypothetical protein n=1 Tax=Lactobacillus acidophilus TaxID=1579 RepID=UPI0021A420F5|nr:hypothetical protein [Lactobacillus acidophilus]MCT3602851.1 hypothetical protein [Lactobacillus acidophilus]MCT3623311.1 hypothetical protein [Lactobacillus acidophilus]